MTADPRPAASPASDAAFVPASFLRTLAHELRNYVAPVQNAMHLLRLRGRNDPTLPPVIDIVDRQLANMLRALDAIGEADRTRRGELVLSRTTVDVRSLVDRALEATRSLQAARTRAVELAIPADLPALDVDADRVARAIAAVLDNALRYSPSDAKVEITAHRDGNAVVVRVRDAGPGLPPEITGAVHAPFAAPHVQGHGLGLGLPLARALVALHGGELRASSGAQGTEVDVRLPAVPAVAQGTPGDAPGAVASTPAPAGRRVLIADDSAAVRTSLADLLQEMGHEVRAAADGAEAVSLAKAWRPEFVLLDVNMPRLNGFDAARQIRAAFPAPQMTLVLMSGEDLDYVMRRGAREAGFDHCLDKGLAIGELGAILEGRAPRPPIL